MYVVENKKCVTFLVPHSLPQTQIPLQCGGTKKCNYLRAATDVLQPSLQLERHKWAKPLQIKGECVYMGKCVYVQLSGEKYIYKL